MKRGKRLGTLLVRAQRLAQPAVIANIASIAWGDRVWLSYVLMTPLPRFLQPDAYLGPGRLAIRKSAAKVLRKWSYLFPLFWALWFTAGHAQTHTTLVPLADQLWHYNDSAIDLGTTWRASSYPLENSWPLGTALFGVESSYPYPYADPLRTPLVLGAGRTTYYFRTHFTFNGPATNLQLLATATIDDGAVFYLNGAEVGRVRMPAGAVQFSTHAQLNYPEGPLAVLEFPLSALAAGDNVLAVEVHQASDTSSDVVFGMVLETYALERPFITVPTQPADMMLSPGQAATLEVFASGYPPPAYQWYKDGLAIAGATASTLQLTGLGAQEEGRYLAVITNLVGSVTSRVALVTFHADITPPRVIYALGLPSLNEVQLIFSEPVDQSIAEDYLNWSMEVTGGGALLSVVDGRLENSTNLVLTTAEFREAGTRYEVVPTVPIPDLSENSIPAGTVIPIALFDTVLVPDLPTQPWRYNQAGVDLGADWVRPEYPDQDWLSGPAPFDAYRSTDQSPACRDFLPGRVPVGTCLTLSNATGTAQIPTSYFRTRFQFLGDPASAVLHFETTINDGAVFYLNGTEVLRVGMPDGPPHYDTLANRLAGDDLEEFDAPAPSLIAGDNVLAIELHQQSLSSFDLTLGLRATGIFPSPPQVRPELQVQIVAGDLEISWSPASATLESALTLDGPWTVLSPSNPGRHVTPMVDPQRFYRVVLP